jgi:hypothetical protein
LKETKADALRQAIRQAVTYIIAADLYVSAARVKEHVRLHQTGTGRESLFQQALSEVKAEIGIVK